MNINMHKDDFEDKIDSAKAWYHANKNFVNDKIVLGALIGGIFGLGFMIGRRSVSISSVSKVVESPVVDGSYAIFFNKAGNPTCSAELFNIEPTTSIM